MRLPVLFAHDLRQRTASSGGCTAARCAPRMMTLSRNSTRRRLIMRRARAGRRDGCVTNVDGNQGLRTVILVTPLLPFWKSNLPGYCDSSCIDRLPSGDVELAAIASPKRQIREHIFVDGDAAFHFTGGRNDIDTR